MAKTRRGRSYRSQRPDTADERAPDGSGGSPGQIGLFETVDGLPDGPAAIALGPVQAIVVYSISHRVGFVARR